jgi:hypothetical protein
MQEMATGAKHTPYRSSLTRMQPPIFKSPPPSIW